MPSLEERLHEGRRALADADDEPARQRAVAGIEDAIYDELDRLSTRLVVAGGELDALAEYARLLRILRSQRAAEPA